MFWFGKVTCLFCERRVSATAALRGRGSRDAAVCWACYEKWERNGRACIVCRRVVQGPHELGAFLRPRPSFGHADCGGVPLKELDRLPARSAS